VALKSSIVTTEFGSMPVPPALSTLESVTWAFWVPSTLRVMVEPLTVHDSVWSPVVEDPEIFCSSDMVTREILNDR